MNDSAKYMVVYETGPTSYGAYVPDLPGCIAVGETMDEVQQLIREGIDIYIEELQRRGDPILPPAHTKAEFIEVHPVLAKAS